MEVRSGEGDFWVIVSPNPRTNVLPTSADFTKLAYPPHALEFSAEDFPFTDQYDNLGGVRIKSLPAAGLGSLKFDGSSVAVDQSIDVDSLDKFTFEPGDSFTGGATFQFELEDSHGATTSAHAATIDLNAPVIDSVAITSRPALGDTYAGGDTVQVTVTWDQRVDWDISATGSAISLDLEIGSATRTAALVTEGKSTGRAVSLVFEYPVKASDSDLNGIKPLADASENVVQLTDGATLKNAANHPAGLALDPLPGEDALHKVNGGLSFNRPPAFSGTPPLSRSVAENSAAGTAVGAPVVAYDPTGDDTLTYTLTGVDAASFDIGAATGQIRVGQGATLDYESHITYSVTVNVSDGKNGRGAARHVRRRVSGRVHHHHQPAGEAEAGYRTHRNGAVRQGRPAGLDGVGHQWRAASNRSCKN